MVRPQRGGQRARPGKIAGVVLAWATFERSSNPGIRRPRWGGVVEGVADFRHPLAYEIRADRLSELTPVTELTGIGVTDASLCGY